ncbi:MarR family winged helix-turn-helix transcriptional regulator [Serpentinicella alkaliphila]|uniref:MarR family winged helix-turn-helix transcriptional regulator n=1 Tax=Serpentinicella alkaliphila TaxID=1734049 RepID=UPI001FA98CC3|nr:MarR family transcriptional regulator [Serpentinicella alkaliphila]
MEFDSNFSKSELLTLLLVERYGQIIMSQIAEHINLPMSTTSGMVERLVKGGFLKRERSEEDRRIVVIALTEQGKGLVSKLKRIIHNYINKITEELTEEVQLLYKIFIKTMNIINNMHNDETIGGKENSGKIKKIEIE